MVTVPGPAMARPGSTDSLGLAAQAAGDEPDVRRVVASRIRDAEPAAEVEFGDLYPVLVADPHGKLDDPVRGDLETGGVVDLGADVRVQAGEIKTLAGQYPADRLVRSARGEREAELLVVMRRGHECVRGGFDAGGDAD